MNSYTNASRNPSLDLKRQQLEQLWHTTQPNLTTRTTQALKQLGNWLLTVLTESNNLQIRAQETPNGTHWSVQDRLNQRQVTFDSEEALRAWLERRYYEG